MGKLALWLVLGVAAWLAWQAWRRAQRASIRHEAEPAAPVAPADAPEAMVRCAHCGLHLPAGEALRDGPFAYCGVAHRDAHRVAPR